MLKTAINSNLLFSDQYIEILLHVSKENKKNKVITNDYSILIEKENPAILVAVFSAGANLTSLSRGS